MHAEGTILYCDMTAESRNGGPKQTSIAEQRIGNYVPVATNSNERVVAR
jgi:hypothetical protein